MTVFLIGTVIGGMLVLALAMGTQPAPQQVPVVYAQEEPRLGGRILALVMLLILVLVLLSLSRP